MLQIIKSAFLVMLLVCNTGLSAEPARHQEFPTYFAHVNGISVAYQDFGAEDAPVVLLVMGLGGQLIHWNDRFVQQLVAAGYRVIRYDNRDVGLSEKFLDYPTPGMLTFVRFKLGMGLGAPYHLDDMAADGVALLDHLHISKAHVAGLSMGGMIAQIMAASYPQRISSLASIMSSSGAAHLPAGTFKVENRDRADLSREEIIQQSITAAKAIYAKDSGLSDEQWYAFSARGYDRSHYDDGFSRQYWAILDSGDRVELLKTIRQPTVVIHGKIDPLLPFEHGQHTASLVENSSLVAIEDMGHFIGVEHNSRIIQAILDNIQRANR
ncbi:MAG: alpha/beta hydrolase [Gammaproteobacteria bacterium]|nr:alpha/beta hydrolase [Gammaproteobacteria bacterium]